MKKGRRQSAKNNKSKEQNEKENKNKKKSSVFKAKQNNVAKTIKCEN